MIGEVCVVLVYVQLRVYIHRHSPRLLRSLRVCGGGLVPRLSWWRLSPLYKFFS